jgi:hypothetical protein
MGFSRRRLVSGLAAGLLSSAAVADTLLGNWVRDRAAQPANIIKTDYLAAIAAWIPIPRILIPGSGSTSGGKPVAEPDPKVLLCRKITIELVGEDIHLTYVGFGEDRLRLGNFVGARTTFTPSKLTSRYQTKTREVKKTYVLTKEGRLHVTVKINPNWGKTLIYQRIFDRVI